MNKELSDTIKAALGTYTQVRDAYYQEIFVSIYDYLDGDGSIATFKNAMKRAMVNAFTPAAENGWQDGGVELPMSDEVNVWLTAALDAELGHIDLLFQNLKELRKSEDVNKTETAQARADGYTQTLDFVYNHAKIAAAGNGMLTFAGDDGKESCTDCKKYKGKRHKASWWIEHDAIPPNRGFECHGYNCQHTLVDDKGTVWTL